MRLKIKAETEQFNRETYIPVNYQYQMASVIYRVFEKGDSGFSDWLHQKGYTNGNKRFKLFTFSKIYPERYRISEDKILLDSPKSEFIISFYLDRQLEPFVKGLFSDTRFSISGPSGKTLFKITGVEMMKDPEFSSGKISFRTLSPLVISFKPTGKKYAEYLSPASDGYKELFIRNLIQKYSICHGRSGLGAEEDILNTSEFIYSGEPKRKGINIKEGRPDAVRIIGYEYRFTVKLPESLIKIGYHSGFGEKNSMGFGCVEVI